MTNAPAGSIWRWRLVQSTAEGTALIIDRKLIQKPSEIQDQENLSPQKCERN